MAMIRYVHGDVLFFFQNVEVKRGANVCLMRKSE